MTNQKYDPLVDCPVDRPFHYLADLFVGVLGCRFSPNTITYASLILYILSAVALPFSTPIFILLFILGYVCDAADGKIARRCLAYSKYGECLDLLKDNVVYFGMFIYVYLLYSPPFIPYCATVFLIAGLSATTFGLLEIHNCYRKYGHGDILSLKRLKFSGQNWFYSLYLRNYALAYYLAMDHRLSKRGWLTPAERLKTMRWFGPGSGVCLTLFLILLVKGLICGL